MKTTRRIVSTVLAIGVGVLADFSQAQTVSWGTSVSVNPLAFDSYGNVDNENHQWELGWFNDGFIPDANNWSQWETNWNRVSSPVAEPDPLPPYEMVNYPTHRDWDGLWAVSVNTYDVGLLAAGKQQYIFSYNDMDLFGTASGEALLFRQDGLVFPTVPNQETFDVADNPLDDGLAFNDDTFTVVWGRVDREMYNLGGVLTGGGVIHSLVPDSNAQPYDALNGTFETQTATWVVVPEPTSALLVLLGFAALLRRKRA